MTFHSFGDSRNASWRVGESVSELLSAGRLVRMGELEDVVEAVGSSSDAIRAEL